MSFLDRADFLAKKIERFLSGDAVADPLYITNRPLGQRIRLGLLLGVPALAVAGFMALALNKYFDPSPSTIQARPVPTAPTGEMTAKLLPLPEKELDTARTRDLDIVEAAVFRNAVPTLTGKVRNNTDHLVRVADIVFDVTDGDGSQLGGVSIRVENIAAKSTAPFKAVLEHRSAKAALVREIRSR